MNASATNCEVREIPAVEPECLLAIERRTARERARAVDIRSHAKCRARQPQASQPGRVAPSSRGRAHCRPANLATACRGELESPQKIAFCARIGPQEKQGESGLRESLGVSPIVR
jgi:hypothetical protein